MFAILGSIGSNMIPDCPKTKMLLYDKIFLGSWKTIVNLVKSSDSSDLQDSNQLCFHYGFNNVFTIFSATLRCTVLVRRPPPYRTAAHKGGGPNCSTVGSALTIR